MFYPLKEKLIHLFILLIFIFLYSNIYSQTNDSIRVDSINTYVRLDKKQWVDSVFSSMDDKQKIGQLFIIRAHSDKSREYHLGVKQQIIDYQVGGVCFFQGTAAKQLELVHEYNSASKLPLFVAIDGEWGVGMRLENAIDFPRQMTIGATNDTALIYKIGKAIAEQCKAVGVNINFAPVVDVNSNPQNPVINSRSFGENPYRTAQLAWQIAKGMQDNNVYACAKHFPGHGNTISDSHKTLPVVDGDYAQLDSIHFFPFRYLSKKGIKSVMVAHLFIPTLDTTADQASSLSPKIVNGLLFDSLNFKGLAITDALEMKGVSNYFEPGEIELRALMAGNDLLLMPPNIDLAIEKIQAAVDSGIVSKDYLNQKIKKILAAKYDLGLGYPMNNSDEPDPMLVINSQKNQDLIEQAYKEALTLVQNKNGILPLQARSSNSLAIVSIGMNEFNDFSKNILTHRKASLYSLPSRSSSSQVNALVDSLKTYDEVIVNVMDTRTSTRSNYGIYQATIDFVNQICQNSKIILVISANPYSATRFLQQCQPKAVLIAYEDNEIVHKVTANSIFGTNPIRGKLPVSISSKYKEGYGIETKKTVMGTCSPEEIGFNSIALIKIDSIVDQGISDKAYPGARVLIAKDGYIFYDKSFGNLTYTENDPVVQNTVYDLASITKVMATTIAIMDLARKGIIDIDLRLSDYLPELKGTNKKNIFIRDLLAHQARLQPWIPFYLDISKNGIPDTAVLSMVLKPGYSTQVSANLFIKDSYKDTIFKRITESELLTKKAYRYSDLGMYYMQKIIENLTGETLDSYCDSIFYKPLHLDFTTFNPLKKIDTALIAPTEMDTYFRKELIRGFVHDQGAAMLGGVGGHAGLFSTADNLAVICQMFLQKGYYDQFAYLDSNILEDFTSQQFPLDHNRRGLGFDKPLPLHQGGGPTCPEVSSKSYGHSGFTGTYFWVDPKYNLIYIFLSNRVNPSAENRKLITQGIRTTIQQEIYRQMGIKY